MLALKAPGVTAGKINSITALCNANIQVSRPSVAVLPFSLPLLR